MEDLSKNVKHEYLSHAGIEQGLTNELMNHVGLLTLCLALFLHFTKQSPGPQLVNGQPSDYEWDEY